MLMLYRAPFSTNVERVALALAHKRLEVESVVISYEDRSPVIEVSGQELVPVLVDGDKVVPDSVRILRYLETKWPDPPLFPREPARREELAVFLDWFNEVWKLDPNTIEDELEAEKSKEAQAALPPPSEPAPAPPVADTPPVTDVPATTHVGQPATMDTGASPPPAASDASGGDAASGASAPPPEPRVEAPAETVVSRGSSSGD